MTRIDDPGFDGRIADWLEADPHVAPPDLMRTVEAALPSIPQRRVRLPWRLPRMSTFAKLAVAAVAVIAVGTLGIVALQPGGSGIGSAPAASPSPTASPTPSTPSSTPAPSPTPPPLTETFTSPTNGITIAYPAGWQTSAATQPWTEEGWPSFRSPTGDFMYDVAMDSSLFIAVASQALGDTPGPQWAADTLAVDDGCAASDPVTIDGVPGLVGADGCLRATVTSDGRGYLVILYTGDGLTWQDEAYDATWFRTLLATVDLPEGAASAAPSP